MVLVLLLLLLTPMPTSVWLLLMPVLELVPPTPIPELLVPALPEALLSVFAPLVPPPTPIVVELELTPPLVVTPPEPVPFAPIVSLLLVLEAAPEEPAVPVPMSLPVPPAV